MDYIAQFCSKTTLILLGAGDSSRFLQKGLPKKQWLRIKEKPLWLYLADRFSSFGFKKILITGSNQEYSYMQSYTSSYRVVEGGKSRTQSILNALEEVQTEYVLIHDIARWNPQIDIIQSLFSAMHNERENACIAPRLKLVDTLFHQDKGYIDREGFYAIQTPQLSKTKILKEALQRGEFSDESSAILALGKKVGYVDGDPLLYKLTYPQDLFFFSKVLPSPSLRVFVGNGIDIHPYCKNKTMVLCGVEIDYPYGFKAHSDGDVGIHSIIDALLGAVGAGDIGEWFPDSDEQYRQIDSKILLKEIALFIRNIGYEINQIDLTILAEEPKISSYKQKMKVKLAEILNLEIGQINIKATTGEKMGFIGRKEGVCVMSCVSLHFIDWRRGE